MIKTKCNYFAKQATDQGNNHLCATAAYWCISKESGGYSSDEKVSQNVMWLPAAALGTYLQKKLAGWLTVLVQFDARREGAEHKTE